MHIYAGKLERNSIKRTFICNIHQIACYEVDS